MTRVILCGLMATKLILATSLTVFPGLVLHVNKADSMDGESEEGASVGVDNNEVRILLLSLAGDAVCTSGELSGVKSKSLGDNESTLSMPLSFSVVAAAANKEVKKGDGPRWLQR